MDRSVSREWAALLIADHPGIPCRGHKALLFEGAVLQVKKS